MRVVVSEDEEEVGVLVVRLLDVGNGAAGGVEAGSLEDPTVKRGTLAQSAASDNICIRRVSSVSGDSWRYWVILPFSAEAKFMAA